MKLIFLTTALLIALSCMTVRNELPSPCLNIPHEVQVWLKANHSVFTSHKCLPSSPDSGNHMDLIFTGSKRIQSRLHGWKRSFPNIPTLFGETHSTYVFEHLQGDLTQGDLFSPFSERIVILDKQTGKTMREFRVNGKFQIKLLHNNVLYLKPYNTDTVVCHEFTDSPTVTEDPLPQRSSSPLIESIRTGDYSDFVELLASDDPLEPMMNGSGTALDEAVSKANPKHKNPDARFLHAIMERLSDEQRIDCHVRLSLARADDENFFPILNQYNIGVEDPIDYNDGTFLMYACHYGWYSRSRITGLLSVGADVNAKTKAGITPLMWAIPNAEPDSIQELLTHGADIHARSVHGETPLMVAVGATKVELIRLLLDLGANPNERDNYGRSAKDYLPDIMGKKERAEILQLMEQHSSPENN